VGLPEVEGATVKITSVETFAVRVDMAVPRGPSILSYRARESLFIKIQTDSGLVGWGETYCVAGVEAAIRDVLAPMLVGQDPLEGRRLRQQMLLATFENGFAVGGVDLALHDVWGKALGVPIHVLYGGALRLQLEPYASLPGYHDDKGPEDHWFAEVAELAAAGLKGVKLRIGRFPPARELPILARIRETLPKDVKLMADGNAAYSSGPALEVARALAELGFGWFEEPLPQSGYLGYPELRAKCALPLAGGESLATRIQGHELLNRGCFDIIQPDVSICGGIAECLFIGELARLHAVRCIPHCWGGGVMLAATLQVAALLPDVSRLAGGDPPLVELDVTENPFRTTLLVGDPFVLRNGYISLPSGPGLGIEVDESVLTRYAA